MSMHDDQLSQLMRNQSLKKAFWFVAVAYVALMVVIAFGVPSWKSQEPFDMTKAVSVDLVAANSDTSAAPNKTSSAKKYVPNAKPKDQPTEPPKAQPEKPPAAVKSDAAKKEDIVKPDEEQLVKPKPVEKPPEKKLATEKVDDKPKLEKKKPEKKKPVKDDNQGEAQKQEEFNSILKNLISDETDATPDGNPVDAPVDEKAKVSGAAPTTSDTLQLSEMDALRYQLAKCWNIPSGAMNAEDLIVDIRIEVNEDRSVKSAEIVDQSRYRSDDFFRAAADSARRAVFNPMCNPLALPADKYDVWKDILIRFNPKEMFGG